MSIYNVDKELNFFVHDEVDIQAIENIAVEARKRNYEVNYIDEPIDSSDIGIYTHARDINKFGGSKLSIIMFHGIDQGYFPKRWPKDDWSLYDVGLLPSEAVADNWRSNSIYPHARPNIGVFITGWPKADKISSKSFEEEVKRYKEDIGLDNGCTIIYAPTSEDHGKMQEFVKSARGLADNLLIKHAPYESGEYLHENVSLPDIYNDVQHYDEVKIIDKKDNILYGLAVSDILVSDESSVLQEAILTKTLPISVTDWPIRQELTPSSRYKVPDFAIKTKCEKLSLEIENVISNQSKLTKRMLQQRNYHYKYLGESSKMTMDLIDSFTNGEKLSQTQLEPQKCNIANYGYYWAMKNIENVFYNYRLAAERNLPKRMKDIIRKTKIPGLSEKLVSNYKR